MTFAAEIAYAAPPDRTGEEAVCPGYKEKLSVTVQMRPVLEDLLTVKLISFDGRIPTVASVTSDIVLKVDTLFPLLHDSTEFSGQVLMAGYAGIVFVSGDSRPGGGVFLGKCTTLQWRQYEEYTQTAK